MPYTLRKAPGKNKYWVVAQDGKHLSKQPMPLHHAKQQMKAVYAEMGRRGGDAGEFIPSKVLQYMSAATYNISKRTGKPFVDDLLSSGLAPFYEDELGLSNRHVQWSLFDGTSTMLMWVSSYYSQATGKSYKTPKGRPFENVIVFAVRGTQGKVDEMDWKANRDLVLNTLWTSERYKKDATMVRQLLKVFQEFVHETEGQWAAGGRKVDAMGRNLDANGRVVPRFQGGWSAVGVGHSLGGAIVDGLLRHEGLDEGISFNPAIQYGDLGINNEGFEHKRIYMDTDPCYALFGQFAYKNRLPPIVYNVSDPFWTQDLKHTMEQASPLFKDWMNLLEDELRKKSPAASAVWGTLVNGWGLHKIQSFKPVAEAGEYVFGEKTSDLFSEYIAVGDPRLAHRIADGTINQTMENTVGRGRMLRHAYYKLRGGAYTIRANGAGAWEVIEDGVVQGTFDTKEKAENAIRLMGAVVPGTPPAGSVASKPPLLPHERVKEDLTEKEEYDYWMKKGQDRSPQKHPYVPEAERSPDLSEIKNPDINSPVGTISPFPSKPGSPVDFVPSSPEEPPKKKRKGEGRRGKGPVMSRPSTPQSRRIARTVGEVGMLMSAGAFGGATIASVISTVHTVEGFNTIGGYVGLGLSALSFFASAVMIRQNLDPLVIQEQAPQVAVQIANALSEVASNHPNIHMFNLGGVSVTHLPPVEMTADQEDPILMTGFGNWDVVGQCLDEYGTNIDAGRNFYHWETLLGISQAARRRDGSFPHPMTRQEVHDIIWFRALVPDAEPLPSALEGRGVTSSKPWQNFERGTHKVVQVGKKWGISQNGKVLLNEEDGSTAVWDSAKEAQKAIDLYYNETLPTEKEKEKKAIEEAVEKERQHILKFWNTHTEVGDWGAKKLPKGQKGTQETTYHPDVVNEYKRVALLLEAKQVPEEVKALLREHIKGIEKVFPELKGYIYGKGRQHKDFLYSRPDLTTAEKARERAKHYRTVQREKNDEDEKVPGRPRTPAYYHKVTGEVVEPYSSKGTTRAVKLTEQQQKTEAARGLKEKKKKVTEPKKDSERKPYVGAKMKREFLAVGTETQFRAAKRAYKKGGVTWESLFPTGSS